uniref:Uncharacterized protein n=1 Tax=Solanum lycopersicum TaxID=4081 RepID=A0A3Q7J0L3_SOLLC
MSLQDISYFNKASTDIQWQKEGFSVDANKNYLKLKKKQNTQSDEHDCLIIKQASTSTNPTPIPPSSLSVPAAQNTPRTAQLSSDPPVGSHNVPYRIQPGADPSRSYRIVAIHHTCNHRSSDAAGF